MADNARTIALKRLSQQRLSQNSLATAGEVVSWLGAVQAQDYLDSKWSLGLRMARGTEEAVEKALDEGAILRTHAMRPTWHYVAPKDIRWLQALTGPRVHQQNGTLYRRLGLEEGLRQRCTDIMAEALAGHHYLTRAELGEALATAGIEAKGQRLGYIVMHAELDAVICSGPRRGKQFTYALVAERATQARELARDEALAELTRRFFTSHGPATERDLAWWSGLTLGDVRLGLRLTSSELDHEEDNGNRYWFATSSPPMAVPTAEAFLLPTYDEFLMGYAAADRVRIAGVTDPEAMLFFSTLVLDGQVTGTWRRTFDRDQVLVELAPFQLLSAAEEAAVFAAVKRFGAFLQMPVEIALA